MREIDLIPGHYRERQKIKQWCHVFFWSAVFLLMLTVFLALGLNIKNRTLQADIGALQKDKSFNMQQQKKYNDMLALERREQKNLEILDALRGGPGVQQILMSIDRVLNPNVWFLQWTFKRAGEIADVQPGTVQNGYFLIIPPENSGNGKQQAWKLDTHMEIKGQARDHSSLSMFVQDLLNQPEIADVKVEHTRTISYVNTQVIDFSLVVLVKNQIGDHHV